MHLQLRPVTARDVPQCVDTVLEAFATNTIHRLCLPHHLPASYGFWATALLLNLQDPNARFLAVEDTEGQPATLVAFAKWVAVPAYSPPDPLPCADVWPQNAKLAACFFGTLKERHEAIMSGRPHWYLELVCTRPRFQGEGAGGMLVRWGIDSADEDGWDAYLDSTPDGKTLYERYGFREVDALTFLDGKYEQCFMVRVRRRAKPG